MGDIENQKQLEQPKTKVFLSYSRKNLDWADWLVEELTDRGIEVLIDREDIVGGEAWEPRIYSLIDQADTVIFLISTPSVTSKICHQEVDYAESLNKRFIPLLLQDPVSDTGEKISPPDALSRINYIFFDKGSDPHKSVDDLVEALLVDLDWVREHTRLGERAQRWQKAGHPTSQLLRGKDLDAAEAWRDTPQKTTRPPTELQLHYISACRKDAGKRRNMLMGSLVAGLVIAVGLGGLAFWQRGEAVKAQELAEQNENKAIKNEKKANIATKQAEKNLQRADNELSNTQRNQSKFLAGRSKQLIKAGNIGTGLLLAIEAMPDENNPDKLIQNRPFWPEAHIMLNRAMSNFHPQEIIKSNEHIGAKVAYSPDGTQIAFISSGKISIISRKTRAQIAIIEYAGKDISTFSFSPDGSQIVSGTSDGDLSVWDFKSKKKQGARFGHKEGISSIEFSPDGLRLASCSSDTTIRLWDIKTYKLLTVLRGHEIGGHEEGEGCNSISFFPKGRKLASGGGDNYIRIWDTQTGKQLTTLNGHEDGVRSIAVSPDGTKIFSTSSDSTIRLWNAQSHKQLALLTNKIQAETGIFTPNGQNLITGSSDGVIRIWDANSYKLLKELYGHSASIQSLSYSANGANIISSSRDHTVRLWSTRNPKDNGFLFEFGANEGLSLSPGGQKILLNTEKGNISLWDIERRKKLSNVKEDIRVSKFSPNGKIIVTSSKDGSITSWSEDLKKKLIKWETYINEETIDWLKFSPDGHKLLSLAGRKLRVWDVKRHLSLFGIILAKQVKVTSTAISPDGSKIALGTDRNGLHFYDGDMHRIDAFKKITGSIRNISFSPDNKLLAYKNYGTFYLLDLMTQQQLAKFEGDSLLFSPDNKLLAYSKDNTIYLWDLKTQQQIAALQNRPDDFMTYVTNFLFTPNGRIIISGNYDGTVRLWDIQKQQQLSIFRGHKSSSYVLAISPDGRRIVSKSDDGKIIDNDINNNTIRISNVILKQKLLIKAQKNIPYCLFPSERRKFFLSPQPPRWCITGPKYTNSPRDKWRGKWPYDTGEWKEWLASHDKGIATKMPVIKEETQEEEVELEKGFFIEKFRG